MSKALREEAVALYREGLARITPEFLLRQAVSLAGQRLSLTFLDRVENVSLAPEALDLFGSPGANCRRCVRHKNPATV